MGNRYFNAKNSPAYLFYAGVFLSIAIPVIFFLSFNRVVYATPKIATGDNSDVIYNVDQCDYFGGKIRALGWATPKEGYGQILAYADLDGKVIQLRTSSTIRTDVSAAMGKMGVYDHSGFYSSLRSKIKAEKVKLILQITRNNKVYVVEHECK